MKLKKSIYSILLSLFTTFFGTIIIPDYIRPFLQAPHLYYSFEKPSFMEVGGNKFREQRLIIYLKGRRNTLEHVEAKINGEEIDYRGGENINEVPGMVYRKWILGTIAINDEFYRDLISIQELRDDDGQSYVKFNIERLYRSRPFAMYFCRRVLLGEEIRQRHAVEYTRSKEVLGEEKTSKKGFNPRYINYAIIFLLSVIVFYQNLDYISSLIARKKTK